MPRCTFGLSGYPVVNVMSAIQATVLPEPVKPAEPICPNCGAPLVLKESRFGPFYGCSRWRKTGCKGSAKANADGSMVGVPVDDETKEARRAAWEAFDQLWKGGRMTRQAANGWLAEKMKMRVVLFGLLSAKECREVIDLVAEELTESEELLMAERALRGGPSEFSDGERKMIEALPVDPELLTRRLRAGHLKATEVCALLRISMGADEAVTLRNISDALQQYRRDKRFHQARAFPSMLDGNDPDGT